MAKSWLELGNEIAQITFVLLGAPLVSGLHQKIKAYALKEPSRPLLQEYRELWRLLQKDSALSENASAFSAIAPFGLLGIAIFAAALTPFFSPTPIGGLGGDLLVLFGLWIMTKAWLSLSALESGHVNGMAASRSMTLFVLLLPTFFLCWMLTLEPLGTAPFFVETIEVGAPPKYSIVLSQVLALFSFGMFLWIELSSKTTRADTESTFGGRLLGLVSYSLQVWRLIWYVLLSVYFISPLLGATTLLSAGISLLKVGIVIIVYGFAEASLARKRFFSLHEYAAISLGLAFLANASFALGG
jgi:hydrogenase-4 component C